MLNIRAARRIGKDGYKYVGLGAALLFAAAIALLVAHGSSSKTAEETVILDEARKLASCRTDSISLIKPDRIDLFLLSQLSDFCYNQVRGEDLLGDFHVRKLNFVQQESDSRILLWMVVAITISGVLLAGLQLLAAYRLASVVGGADFGSQQGGEVKIDPKSISLKSSVTGLLILIISFAFFIVYVRWVYPIQTRMDPEADASTWKPPLMFRPGGAGWPSQEPSTNETKKPPSVEGPKF
jgi:hypothetical protein